MRSAPPNKPFHLTPASLPAVGRSAAGERPRWADQSESATTMTTQAVIVGRGGGLLTWDGRL